MCPDTPRDETNHSETQPGNPPRGAVAPAEEARQPQMSQPSYRPRAADRDQARWLVPDTRDDIVVSRAQEWE